MVKRKKQLFYLSLFYILLLLNLCTNAFPIPTHLSNWSVSADGSLSQDYIVHEAINITNDDELAAVANSGSGTTEDPYIIANWYIVVSKEHGISIVETTKHFRVENCWIESSVDSVEGRSCGIYVRSVASGTTTIINNVCTKNSGSGISLGDSGSSTVANNTCTNNDEEGIILYGSAFSTVTYNTCTNNGWRGISLWDSDNNSIFWNILVENEDYGIELVLGDSADNFIHHNDFIENGQNTTQAYDSGRNNQWYDETVLEGNYWSDYSGTGNYSIDGLAGADDPYPSLSPYRYTSSSSSPASPQDVLVRIGLFLIIIGIFGVPILIRKNK